jgi:membrane-anchored mycosin MYCP
MRGRLVRAALIAVTTVSATLVFAPAAPVHAADPCGDGGAKPAEPIKDVPWQQKWLSPERVWPFATGAGQTVAVIDTGVDGTHDQMQGQVLPGFDVVEQHPDNRNVDCVGHGTAVASLIAAKASSVVGFHGLAPDARILPIRVSNVDPGSDQHGPKQPGPAAVTEAINLAVDSHATVIDVSPSLQFPDPALETAVRRALTAGIVVVAAAGDVRDANKFVDDPTYPAALDGVIGVGALDAGFGRSGNSNIGPYVKVTAPGDGAIAATRIAGHQGWTGTSIAAATVAATAALVRQAWPRLKPDEVALRILAAAVPGVAAPSVDPAAVERGDWWRWTSTVALIATGAAAFLLVVVGALAVVLPRGRRQRWRPKRAAKPVEPVTAVDEEDIFAVPRPHGS